MLFLFLLFMAFLSSDYPCKVAVKITLIVTLSDFFYLICGTVRPVKNWLKVKSKC